MSDPKSKRYIDIFFTKKHKFFNKLELPKTNNYILNINSLMKEKLNTEFFVMNKIQSFVLNIEIKKCIDRSINLKNGKYDNLIYINENMNITSVLNMIKFIEATYKDIKFKYNVIDDSGSFSELHEKRKDIKIVNLKDTILE